MIGVVLRGDMILSTVEAKYTVSQTLGWFIQSMPRLLLTSRL